MVKPSLGRFDGRGEPLLDVLSDPLCIRESLESFAGQVFWLVPTATPSQPYGQWQRLLSSLLLLFGTPTILTWSRNSQQRVCSGFAPDSLLIPRLWSRYGNLAGANICKKCYNSRLYAHLFSQFSACINFAYMAIKNINLTNNNPCIIFAL